MTKIGITTILLCFLLTAMASAGESYLCVADLATGFSYNKAIDKREIAKFKVDDSKYIVSKSDLKVMYGKSSKLGTALQYLGEKRT